MNPDDNLQVIASIAWDSIDDVVKYLRKGGVDPVCEPRPRMVARLTHRWQWQNAPAASTTPLSVPVDQVKRATVLLREWRQQQESAVAPHVARIRRDATIVLCGLLIVGTAFWFLFRDVGHAATSTVFVAVMILVFASLFRKSK